MSVPFPATMAILCSILAGAFMASGHYILPRIVSRELHRVEAYLWGVGVGILLPYITWTGIMAAYDGPTVALWTPVAVLTAIAVGAGLGTGACYILDWTHGHRIVE